MLTVTPSGAELERRAVEAHELLGERCVVCPRGIHREEYEQALALARELGLRLDPRSVGERRRLAHAS